MPDWYNSPARASRIRAERRDFQREMQGTFQEKTAADMAKAAALVQGQKDVANIQGGYQLGVTELAGKFNLAQTGQQGMWNALRQIISNRGALDVQRLGNIGQLNVEERRQAGAMERTKFQYGEESPYMKLMRYRAESERIGAEAPYWKQVQDKLGNTVGFQFLLDQSKSTMGADMMEWPIFQNWDVGSKMASEKVFDYLDQMSPATQKRLLSQFTEEQQSALEKVQKARKRRKLPSSLTISSKPAPKTPGRDVSLRLNPGIGAGWIPTEEKR